MKFLCPSCDRLAAAAAFRIEQNALFLRCARCGTENAVDIETSPAPPARSEASDAAPAEPARPAPAPDPAGTAAPRVVPLRAVTDAVKLAAEAARSADPFAVPDDRCPKCIGERDPEALVCRHCGLAFINFRPEDSAPSAELANAFRHALEQWDAPERHEQVLAIATRRGELAAAGRLYRLRLAIAPLDPVAQRGRDEVLRRAAAASEMFRTLAPTEARTPRWQYVAVVVLALAAAGLMVLLFRRMLG